MCTTAAHGYYHEYLTTRAYTNEKQNLLTKIQKSSKIITENINTQPEQFIYPF